MEVEICHRTGSMWRRGSNVSIGQQTGWNVIHDRRSNAFNVFVLDSKMAKQQLQKWKLKFVTELEPLEGASPVVGSYTPFGFYKDTTIGAGCGRYLKHSSGLWEVSRDSSRWDGSASVRGRVPDDITQCQDDERSVRNCCNLYIFIHFRISGIYFWCEYLGRVTSKVENLVFYKHETGVLFVEGFAEKFLFSFQAQSCPRLFRTLPLMLLRQTAAYKYFQIFLKSCLQSLCVFNCRGIVFLTNPTVCLKSVSRPKKNSFSWGGGFLPSASQTHRGCGQSFAI